MKKILLLTENFPPVDGGSSRWFWELYSRLTDFEVHVLTNKLNEQEEIEIAPHMRLVRMDLKCREWGIKSLSGIKFYFKTVRKIKKYIRIHSIDEIHCGRVIHEGVSAWFLYLLTRKPYRCFIHGEDLETANTSREQSLLVQRVCSNAKSLICNSENSANLVESLGFGDRSICEVLNPGVDTQKFFPTQIDKTFRESMGWQDKFVLLTVGRLQRRKGQDFFIKAIPKLLETRKDLLYVIIGRGELEPELRQLVKDLSIEKHVQIHSNFNDSQMITCYQQCDGFILPNRTIGNDIEGFGMVLVEAQACGKGVIAGDSGGTREAMSLGKTGFVVDCNSPESITSHVSQLIAPIDGKNEYMTKLTLCQSTSREYVLNNLDWDAHVAKAKEHFIS